MIPFWTHQGSEFEETIKMWVLKKQVRNTKHFLGCDHSDSPHSVQTLYGCTIYETAQNPGDLSLLQLPVKAEHRSTEWERLASMRTSLFQIQISHCDL